MSSTSFEGELDGTDRQLVGVLGSVIDLLRKYNEDARADWLLLRKAALTDSDTSRDARQTAKQEIHKILSGMGGLTDLRLPSGGHADQSATEKLYELADRLFELTR